MKKQALTILITSIFTLSLSLAFQVGFKQESLLDVVLAQTNNYAPVETISTRKLPSFVSPLPENHQFFQSVRYDGSDRQIPMQMDINGDGLQDLIFKQSRHTTADTYTREEIYINSGGQYKIIFKCHYLNNRNINESTTHYTGHCADADYAL